jgi:hypothetical protein
MTSLLAKRTVMRRSKFPLLSTNRSFRRYAFVRIGHCEDASGKAQFGHEPNFKSINAATTQPFDHGLTHTICDVMGSLAGLG